MFSNKSRFRPVKAGAATIAPDEPDGWMETAHLLRSPKNAERLLAALRRARAGNLKPMALSDLRKDAGLDE